MNTELDSQRVIINPNNFEKCEFPHFSVDTILREPSPENPTIRKISDSSSSLSAAASTGYSPAR